MQHAVAHPAVEILLHHQAVAHSVADVQAARVGKERDHVQVGVLSQLVLDEAKAGDPDASRERLNVLRPFPLLDIAPEVIWLASALLESGKVPQKAATDAAHIAIATVHRMDFLLTWNCVHIANAAIAKALGSICREHGYECPVICTPEELLGE